ncbi:MAG: MFS transporter [Gammaproteobacteria bacterium]|nr:MFS transporter [Gammaproteobacteria bacterium]
MIEKVKPTTFAWIIFTITASFYAYEFFLRVAPAALQGDIMKQFGINAKEFGILMSAYYMTYTPLQLFVGSLMDLYGPKKTLIVAILSCLIGAIYFVLAKHFSTALIAYALIGFGSAFAFVGVLKLSSNWLPTNYLAIASGIATSMGMIGAITGEYILDITVHKYGYVNSFMAYLFIGVLILTCVIFVVRDQPHKSKITRRAPIKFKTLIRDLLKLRHNGQFWLNSIIGCLLFMPTNIFASMWAVMFFKQTYHISSNASNAMSSLIFAGWAVGAPISGYLVSRGFTIIKLLRVGSICSAVFLTMVIFHKIDNAYLIYLCMFATGFFSSVQVLVFPNAVKFIDKKYSGTAISLTNMVIMLSSYLSPIVGMVLDLSWDGTLENDIRVFSAYGFEQALLILPLALGISFFCTYFMKET